MWRLKLKWSRNKVCCPANFVLFVLTSPSFSFWFRVFSDFTGVFFATIWVVVCTSDFTGLLGWARRNGDGLMGELKCPEKSETMKEWNDCSNESAKQSLNFIELHSQNTTINTTCLLQIRLQRYLQAVLKSRQLRNHEETVSLVFEPTAITREKTYCFCTEKSLQKLGCILWGYLFSWCRITLESWLCHGEFNFSVVSWQIIHEEQSDESIICYHDTIEKLQFTNLHHESLVVKDNPRQFLLSVWLEWCNNTLRVLLLSGFFNTSSDQVEEIFNQMVYQNSSQKQGCILCGGWS